MDTAKPLNGETVWVEYPKGNCFRALYDSAADAFTRAAGAIPAIAVANWSRQLHEPGPSRPEATALPVLAGQHGQRGKSRRIERAVSA
jgi:hypothetical protein